MATTTSTASAARASSGRAFASPARRTSTTTSRTASMKATASTPMALRRLATEQKAELIITVDCGISAVAEARLARELGVELIVTDHHTVGSELPEADVIVHPALDGSLYPFSELCGAAVAFKLAWQVCKSFGDGKKASPHLRDFLVRSHRPGGAGDGGRRGPARSARTASWSGTAWPGIDAEPTVGLRALMEVSGCLDKKKLTTGTVGFNLGPADQRRGPARTGDAGPSRCSRPTTRPSPARSPTSSTAATAGARRSSRTIVAEAHEMIDAQAGRDRRAGQSWSAAGLAPRRDRHRREPAGRDLSPPGGRRGARRLVARAGVGAVDPGL